MKKMNYLAIIAFLICFFNISNAISSSVDDVLVSSKFKKLAELGDTETAKLMLKNNPQLRYMGSTLYDMRLIEEGMLIAASTEKVSYDFVKLMIDNGADVTAIMQMPVLAYAISGAYIFTAMDHKLIKSMLGVSSMRSKASTREDDIQHIKRALPFMFDVGDLIIIDYKAGTSFDFGKPVISNTTTRNERIKIIKLLLEEGADPNGSVKIGIVRVPMLTLAMSDVEIAKLLIESGANPNPINDSGDALIDLYKISMKDAQEKLEAMKSLSNGVN